MTIEQTLITLLTTGSPLTAAGDNVYAVLLPQDSGFPAVQVQRITTTPVADYAGDNRRDFARVQVTCWARTYGAAKDLGREVRSLVAGSADLHAYVETERDDYDQEMKVFGVSTDYLLTGQP